jgi:RAQPRD family integrative conjugative element protein
MKYFMTLLLLLFFSGLSYADNAQMNEALVGIIRQLQAIKPLINRAKNAQTKNPRIKVHFDSWIDGDGKKHNGLRQDIEAIQTALVNIVNGEKIEPRVYKTIQGDFIDKESKNNV